MGVSWKTLPVFFAALICSSRTAGQLVLGPIKDWGPAKPVESEFRTYSEAVVTVFHDGQQISSTLTPNGHYPDITVNVAAFGQTFVLKMQKNRYLFSKSYIEKEVTPDGETYVNTTDILNHCYYTGTVNDDQRIAAAVSTCNGVLGYFEYGNDTYHIEPLDGTIAGRHRVYRDSDSLLPPHHCGESGLHHHAIMNISIHMRSKRSFNWPQDLDGQTRVVELYIANDFTQFVAMGNNTNTVITRTKNIVNIASTLYQPLGIYLVLVGVEVWTERSLVPIVQSNVSATLGAFTKYRETNINPLHPNDNAHLLIGQIIFETSIVGLAYVTMMCSYSLSSAFVSDFTVMPGTAGVVMAHEMGHNFGFLHDDVIGSCSCDDPAGYCIMQSSVGNTLPSRWSQCSKNQLAVSFSRKDDYCLDNIPGTLNDLTAICGNGIVETGEQCDCGNSTMDVCNSACCDRVTCRLVGSATCASGRCCNLTTCQVKPLTIVCRPASGSCDLAEYCSGVDPVCPSDVYLQDGTACTVNTVGAYCYHGRCNTHDSQCQLWYGATVHNGNINCYSIISPRGDQYGHCGYNITTNVYTPCAASDMECGMLYCDVAISSFSQVMSFDAASVYPLHLDNSVTGAVMYNCTAATLIAANYGGRHQDPGLVPNGAACGTGQMCLSQRCVSATALGVPVCPDCHQHGVCNNLGQCHCDVGYSPSDCSQPGGGGSNHSNPIALYVPPTTVSTTGSSSTTTSSVTLTSLLPITTSSGAVTTHSSTTTSSVAATSSLPIKTSPGAAVTSPSTTMSLVAATSSLPITTSSGAVTSPSSTTTSSVAATSSLPIIPSSGAVTTSSSATTSSMAVTSSSPLTTVSPTQASSTSSAPTRPPAPPPARRRRRRPRCVRKIWRKRLLIVCR